MLPPLSGTSPVLHKLLFLLLVIGLVAAPQAAKPEMSADGERPHSTRPRVSYPAAPFRPSMSEFNARRFYFFMMAAPCAGVLALFGLMPPARATRSTGRQADKETSS